MWRYCLCFCIALMGEFGNHISSISSPLFCLSGSAKLAIWLTPKHRANGAGGVEPVCAL